MLNHYLSQALELAKSRRGFCAPNPCVGAILVKDGFIIAEGFHEGPGREHAEVAAINAAGEQTQGADLYVTLEPCCHHGRTPPCTDAIIKAGIKTVYFAVMDPNPQVSNKGAELLRQHGIACEQLPLTAIDDFYQSYQHWWRTKKPYVTAKLAMSIDGKIAGASGVPVAITGQDLAELTHQHRRQSDALLTTVKTLNQDNPQLNVRLNQDSIAKPVYVLDSQLQLNTNLLIFETAKTLTVFHAANASPAKGDQLKQMGVKCVAVDSSSQGLDLKEVLEVIGHDGVHDLWVEAGGILMQHLIQQGLVQRALLYVALKTLGSDALAAFTGNEDLFAQITRHQWQAVGDDVLCDLIF